MALIALDVIYFQNSVGWRSGSAGALQAQGHRFKSYTDHQLFNRLSFDKRFFIS